MFCHNTDSILNQIVRLHALTSGVGLQILLESLNIEGHSFLVHLIFLSLSLYLSVSQHGIYLFVAL